MRSFAIIASAAAFIASAYGASCLDKAAADKVAANFEVSITAFELLHSMRKPRHTLPTC